MERRKRENKKPTTINREIALLRKTFEFGLDRERGYDITNPAKEMAGAMLLNPVELKLCNQQTQNALTV